MDNTHSDLSDRILFGINLAMARLIERKIITDGEFAFSRDGKVIRIKARDLKNKLTSPE